PVLFVFCLLPFTGFPVLPAPAILVLRPRPIIVLIADAMRSLLQPCISGARLLRCGWNERQAFRFLPCQPFRRATLAAAVSLRQARERGPAVGTVPGSLVCSREPLGAAGRNGG